MKADILGSKAKRVTSLINIPVGEDAMVQVKVLTRIGSRSFTQDSMSAKTEATLRDAVSAVLPQQAEASEEAGE